MRIENGFIARPGRKLTKAERESKARVLKRYREAMIEDARKRRIAASPTALVPA